MKSEHISPKLVNSISLTPGWAGLERGITQGKFCAPHRTLVKILCKQSENFVEGAVINYKVILSLSMRLQIVANHPLSPGLSSLWYLYITMQFGFSADSIFTWNTYVMCTETYQGIWDAENKAAICHTWYNTSVCEKYWSQETDKSKSNFHYLPEINNCWHKVSLDRF